MNTSDYFSDNYFSARERFVSAVTQTKGELTIFSHPSVTDQRGPIAVDVARYGPPDASHVLFVVSGVHGTEHAAGSAAQLGLLDKISDIVSEKNLAVVMIHALNPVGCAYVNRADENNVDINRNFVDFSQPLPVNPGYEELHNILCPKHWNEHTRQATQEKIEAFVQKAGIQKLTNQVLIGQYSHADGLFFGGFERSWSAKTALDIFSTHCESATRAAVLDIHTGVGPKGHAEIMDLSLTHHFGSAMYQMTGQMCHVLDEIPHLDMRVKHLIEIGTLEFMEILNVHRANTWLTLYGGANNPQYEEIKRTAFNALCIEEESWKQAVVSSSLDAFNALKNLLFSSTTLKKYVS